jgi:hypothetical protein
MIRYDPAHHVWFVVQWYQRLLASTDLQTVFHRQAHELTNFLSFFKFTATLMFEVDDDGVWFAAWASPFGDIVEFGSWIRPDRRGSKKALVAIDQAHDLVLAEKPILMGLTTRKDLHRLHLKLGYVYTGHLPNFANGATLYLYAMTPESRDRARAERPGRVGKIAAQFERIGAVMN